MEEKIKLVMAEVFGVDIVEIDDKASPETLAAWDSLKQMNLILALEEEFEIQLTDEEVIEMLNLPLIMEIIKNKIHSL